MRASKPIRMAVLTTWVLAAATAASGAGLSVYGAWHCGNDFCTWASVRDMADFHFKNGWIINRGDGLPSANVVILSFVHPLRLLNKTTDGGTLNGVPVGMDANVVNYFKNEGIRVMFSIGGHTYTDAWSQALDTNPTQLGLNAAEMANRFGVGVEIDYEENSNPRLTALGQFINAYRSVIPYDATGANHAARLTIDLAVGNRYLTKLSKEASLKWLQVENPVLDHFNAMVPNTGDATTDQWQEHIDGYLTGVPKAPAKMAGAIWLTRRRNPITNCTDYLQSTQKARAVYAQTVAPNGEGTSSGMQGFLFWAAECPSTRNACTTPPNTCEGGMGLGAKELNIPIPMPALRQQ